MFFNTPRPMLKTSLFSLVLALATLNSCTTVQDENDAEVRPPAGIVGGAVPRGALAIARHTWAA